MRLQIYVIQSIGSYSSDGSTGGGSIHITELARCWSKLRNDVHFVTNSSDNGSPLYTGITKIHMVRSLLHRGDFHSSLYVAAMFFNYFVQKREIENIIDTTRSKIDDAMIVTASPFPSDVFIASHLKMKYGIPAVIYVHHLPPAPWRHPLRRGGITRATYNWLVSQLSLAFMKIFGLYPCINNPQWLAKSGWRFNIGIINDANSLSEYPPDFVHSNRSMLGTFIGRIAPNKGVLDSIRSWKYVVESIPSASLVIAGKCSSLRFRLRIERLIQKLDLYQNVTIFFHHITEDKKKELLERSRVFLFPSYEEGWSLSVMEAAAHGAVPILYNLEAYHYLGPLAPKVKIGDIKALGKAAKAILEDDALYTSISQDLKQRVSSFSLDKIAQGELVELKKLVLAGINRDDGKGK